MCKTILHRFSTQQVPSAPRSPMVACCWSSNSYVPTDAQQHGGRVAAGDRDKGNLRKKKKRLFSAPSHGAP